MSQVIPGTADPVTGQAQTVQQMVEAARAAAVPGFVEMRREYMQNGMQPQQQQQPIGRHAAPPPNQQIPGQGRIF